jgi:H+/gluconate symporter-like permease
MVVLHTAIAILAVIVLIIRFKVDPVISLVISSLYLGLATGVGFTETIKAITTGFGEIMTKVGLLIGFGVLIGSLLHACGVFGLLVNALVRVVGSRRLPYAMTSTMALIFPSIYVDVQVVLASPIARTAGPVIGPTGLARMAGAIGVGIFAGYVFVVPGLAAISIAGLLEVPLGTWLLFGIVIGPITAIVTTLLFGWLLRLRYWKPEVDEADEENVIEHDHEPEPVAMEAPTLGARPPVSLAVGMLPIIVPLLMIASAAFLGLVGVESDLLSFIGNANVALFVGLLGAYLLTRRSLGMNRTGEAMSEGFHTTGEILLVTGVGGSLGAVIEATGLGDVLAQLFTADAGAPIVITILLAWFVAAVLHLAIGSVSVAAITAAGILAPILASLDVAPVAIGLAIASGAMFAVHVNSNFFWMFKSLLGLSTRGALKTLTAVTVIGSVVSLPLVLVVALFA